MKTYQITIDGVKQAAVYTSVPEACEVIRETRGQIVARHSASFLPGSEVTIYDTRRIELVSADGTPLSDSDIIALVDNTVRYRRSY